MSEREMPLGASDVMKRISVRMPGAAPVVHALLGCQWGVEIKSVGDPGPCPEQAVGMMVLHAPDGDEMTFKFCRRHIDYVTVMTDPHKERERKET